MDDFDRTRWHCSCGFGLDKEELVDGYGIFLTYFCEECEKEKKTRFAYALTRYEHDEPLEDY